MTPDEIKRKLLFVPCESKEHLRVWIKTYLDLDYDFNLVCDDEDRHPPSNSTPLDLLWEIYSAAMDGRDPKKTFYLGYAARDSYKTLSCAILEVLCLFHLRRDVAHLAAIESQAANCTKYVENFLKRPILKDFLTSKNKRTLEVTRYEHKDTGMILSPVEYNSLSEANKAPFKETTHFVKIIVATMSGTNSLHCSMLIFDELDLAPPKPVEEAKMIAAPGKQRGELPIIFMTSTRKFNYGLVQKAIDDADKTNLLIRHWNLIDITQQCPTTRHLPSEPEINIWFSEENLKSYSQEEYDSMPEMEQEKLLKDRGYAGCLKNCKLFAMCRGRLATKQTSRSNLLRTVDHVQATFGRVEVETAKAQLLSWKPSTAGLVYPRFDKAIHMIPASQMAEMITGRHHGNISKGQLVDIMREHGINFYAGQDYGYSHAFACVTAGVFGSYMFVVDAFEVPGLEIMQKIEMCDQRIKDLEPIVWGDPASPADIKTFRKHGYKMRDWHKEKGSVKEGIDCVRMKLNPFSGEPQLYLLAGDDGCDLLAKRLSEYHWTMDSAGRVTDVPDDMDDDICDAFRYLVMNVFPIKKAKLAAAVGPTSTNPFQQAVQPQNGWMQDYIRSGEGYSPDPAEGKGRKGRLLWDM